ncbi:SPFH domain-containing protein [Desulfobulbus sp.]|uniref:SPFH domain-containing protein n=1 Tax=Desulfobulbus sp. TaxID=895 RepID=UPI00286EBDCF|nr:SPFH domain-containing protein [Desulfobulbus sp.]
MFGFRFARFQPTDYVLQYRRGKLVREGIGQAFFYFAPSSALVCIPVASVDIPFIFREVTADFQEVTVQGQLTYRVADPQKLSRLMNFSLTADGAGYASEDPGNLPQRLVNSVQVLTRVALQNMDLRQVLASSDTLVQALRQGMSAAEVTDSLGIEVLGLSILAIKPNPETARALEAEAREKILRDSDEAIYARRNAAVEQERAIKENELNTEIAVENKKRQIKEAQMEAEKSVQQKKRELEEAEMATRIALEEKNRELVELATSNERQQADARAYGISATLRALEATEPKVLQTLANVGMDPGRLLALAFKDLAENTGKIGQLNISPDLLRELMAGK